MNRPILEFLHPHSLDFICGCTDYTSLVWENKTDGSGTVEIHIPRVDTRINHGLIIHLCRDIPEPYGIISSVRITAHETTVYASTLSKVFDWRYMHADGYDIQLSATYGVGHLICLCAKYGCIGDNDNDFFGKPTIFSYQDDSVTAVSDTSIDTSCLELMTSIAREGKYCFGCTVENGQLKLFTYPYTDKGQTFDVSSHAIGDLVYTSSCDSHRNVFGYSVGSEEEGYVYRTYPMYESYKGTERRIINLGRFSRVPTAEIREKSALLTESESVEAKLRLPYPQMFSLGEIIEVKNKDWDFAKKLAVTSVKEIWEDKYSCRVTFGFPGEAVYRKLLRIYR